VLDGTHDVVRRHSTFDMVCAFEVLEHIDDDSSAFDGLPPGCADTVDLYRVSSANRFAAATRALGDIVENFVADVFVGQDQARHAYSGDRHRPEPIRPLEHDADRPFSDPRRAFGREPRCSHALPDLSNHSPIVSFALSASLT
jgi:hypothetical protein